MRALYGERRQILIDAITSRFRDTLPVMRDEAVVERRLKADTVQVA